MTQAAAEILIELATPEAADVLLDAMLEGEEETADEDRCRAAAELALRVRTLGVAPGR